MRLPGPLVLRLLLSLACLAVLFAAPAYAAGVVPDVRGKTEIEAQDAIEAQDLTAKIVFVNDPNQADGVVISQMPAPGTAMLKGATVSISVNRRRSAPPATLVVVPRLIGTSLLDALDALRAAGLVADPTRQGPRIAGAVSTVLSQDPAAGMRVAAGSSVRLTHSAVSRIVPAPSTTVKVPNFIGLNAQVASQLAIAEGFSPVLMGPAGVPLARQMINTQSLARGLSVARGTVIQLNFTSSGSGGGTTGIVRGVVPDFLGMTRDEVKTAGTAAGLSLRLTHLPVGTGIPARAGSQNVKAGTRVAFGTEVTVDFTPRAGPGPGTGTGGTPGVRGVVPNFLGLTQTQVQAAAATAGLMLTMRMPSSRPAWQLTANAQSLPAGTRVAWNTPITVDFTAGGGPTGPTGTVVPNFVGMTGSEAQVAGARAGVPVQFVNLASWIDPRVQSQTVPAGTVGGSRPVGLDFTGGGTAGGAVVLPDFSGWVESRLDLWAINNGLSPTKSTVTPPLRSVRRVATGQIPPAGTPLRGLRSFSVVLGNEGHGPWPGTRPAAGVVMPNFIGRPEAEVDLFVRSNPGVSVTKSWGLVRPVPGVARIVTRQSPTAGTLLAPGANFSVTLENATTTPPAGSGVQIPALKRGENAMSYASRLRRAGLGADYDIVDFLKVPHHTKPPEGTFVPKGSTVKLYFNP